MSRRVQVAALAVAGIIIFEFYMYSKVYETRKIGNLKTLRSRAIRCP
jgi:hypothetical protein